MCRVRRLSRLSRFSRWSFWLLGARFAALYLLIGRLATGRGSRFVEDGFSFLKKRHHTLLGVRCTQGLSYCPFFVLDRFG